LSGAIAEEASCKESLLWAPCVGSILQDLIAALLPGHRSIASLKVRHVPCSFVVVPIGIHGRSMNQKPMDAKFRTNYIGLPASGQYFVLLCWLMTLIEVGTFFCCILCAVLLQKKREQLCN
jgi:hypothetical protein